MNYDELPFDPSTTQSAPRIEVAGSKPGFRDALQLGTILLGKLAIPHCVIGAATGYFQRPTKDIDLLVDAGSRHEARRLLRAFVKKGYTLSEYDWGRHHAASLQSPQGIIVDILFVDTEYERAMVGRATTRDAFGVVVNAASPIDILSLKVGSARNQDLLDAADLIDAIVGISQVHIGACELNGSASRRGNRVTCSRPWRTNRSVPGRTRLIPSDYSDPLKHHGLDWTRQSVLTESGRFQLATALKSIIAASCEDDSGSPVNLRSNLLSFQAALKCLSSCLATPIANALDRTRAFCQGELDRACLASLAAGQIAAIAGVALLIGAGALGQTTRAEEAKQEYSIDSKVIQGLNETSLALFAITNKFEVKGITYVMPEYKDGFERKLALVLALGDGSFKVPQFLDSLKDKRIHEYFKFVAGQLKAANPSFRDTDNTGLTILSIRLATLYEDGISTESNGKKYKHVSKRWFNESMDSYNRFYAPIFSAISTNSNLSQERKDEVAKKYANFIFLEHVNISLISIRYDVSKQITQISSLKE